MIKYKQREITKSLLGALKDMPVVVLTGMRQVGKSTLIQGEPALINRHYINLDDFSQLEAARRNPESLIEGDKPTTIDEVQKCPDLLTVIKRAVDRKRTAGRFLLSGSANFALLKGISETLAGRAVYLILYPFTRREITGEVDTEPFLPRFFRSLKIPSHRTPIQPIKPLNIQLGGMPPVCLGKLKDPGLWFKGYEQTFLERDLRELTQVADLLSFRQLLSLAATRTGQILKISELARDAKLNSTTTSRYLNLMETSFVIQRVEPYLGNRAARLIKSPKLYFSDSGIACHLAGVENLESTSIEPLRGAMLETYVAQNLGGILEAKWPQARLYFWHIQGRHEVDFVIESGREVVAVEVKSAQRWVERDLSGLKAFCSTAPNCRAAILAYNGTEAVRLDKKIWAIPLGLLLS
jgi:predicted AAA+ superfamily ATPase